MLLKIIAGFLIIIVFSLIAVSLYFTHKFLYFENIGRDTPEDLGYEYENVNFQSTDGINLDGWYIESNASKVKNTTVLLLHGFSGNKEDMLEGMPYLIENGYDVFSFDFRGHGGSEGTTTLGGDEYKDIHGAVKYLKNRNGNNIYGIGFSMGASSLILASFRDNSIERIVVDSAFANFKKTLDENIRKSLPLDFIFKPFVHLSFEIYGVPLARDDPINSIDKISPRPIFIIHGKEDGLVDVRNAELLYEKAQDPKRQWLVEDTGHTGAFESRKEEYRKKVLDFFND